MPSSSQADLNSNSPPNKDSTFTNRGNGRSQNVQPQNEPSPNVRPSAYPNTQHDASSMGRDRNYMGGGNASPQQHPLTSNQNTQTNNHNPNYVDQSPGKDAKLANPLINANSNKNYNPNSNVPAQTISGNQMHNNRNSPPTPLSSGRTGGSQRSRPNPNIGNNQGSSRYQSPPNRSSDQRQNLPSQQISGSNDRPYTDFIPTNPDRNQKQGPNSQNMNEQVLQQHEPSYPKHVPSRSNVASSNQADLRKLPESHYLPNSQSSSSSMNHPINGNSDSKHVNSPKIQQNAQSANKKPTSDRQAERKTFGNKSPLSSDSSPSSSLSSSSLNWLDNDIYSPYRSNDQKSPLSSSSSRQSSSDNQYYGQPQPSQYYRPYASDSINSFLGNGGGGSQDDFSQFGGPYLESAKPYQLGGRSTGNGYLNYPDSPYGSQYSPPNRYNFGNDFNQPNYQDPDFYLPIGNGRYPDGIYDGNSMELMLYICFKQGLPFPHCNLVL